MTYQTLEQYNATSLDGVLGYVASTIPVFTPFLLLSIYLITSLSVYFGTRKFNGQADIFAAFASAGFFTFVVGIILSFSFGIINTYAIVTTIGIAIFSFIMLMITRHRD